MDFLSSHKITYLLADTTYSTNKQGCLLTTFFTLGPDERNIPIFLILSSSEASNILTICLEGFHKNIKSFDCLNIHVLMTDMANNFNKAITIILSTQYCHLWCAYHFYKTFKSNILKKLKIQIIEKCSVKVSID